MRMVGFLPTVSAIASVRRSLRLAASFAARETGLSSFFVLTYAMLICAALLLPIQTW